MGKDLNLDLFGPGPDPEGAEESPPPVSSDEDSTSVGSPGHPPEVRGSANPPGPVTQDPGSEAEEKGAEEREVWTVSQVNSAVRALLEESLPTLWIAGEVANWKRAGSGHCYFTLKDESAQLRCVMWRGDAARLPMDPEEGMKIRVLGQLTLYESRGEFQLVSKLLEDEGGEGLWRLAFERLRARLDEEGLLAPERKRPLPRFPQTVGIVTSPTGAALHDILTVLRRRAPWLRVLVAGARVQGEGASQEIADAVQRLGGSGRVEVLIVGRGGGSIEDLWAFNEEPVSRAIAACPVPVVSAVGHEVDVTISDLVADVRAPTPSAAAEAVAPDKDEILRYLKNAGERLGGGLRKRVEARRLALSRGEAGIHRVGGRLTASRRAKLLVLQESLTRNGRGLLEPRWRRFSRSRDDLVRAVEALLRSRRETLVRIAGQIDALSPLATLRRGYAVPLDPDGKVLRGTGDFPGGMRFHLRVVDGRVRCEALDTTNDEVISE